MAYGSVSSASIIPVSIFFNGYHADVAAVQQQCPLCTSPDDVGIIAFNNVMSPTTFQVNYMTFDFTTFTPSGATAVGGVMSVPGSFAGDRMFGPRIDAPDDYTINWPSGTSSWFKIVNIVGASTGNVVESYDNLLGGASWPTTVSYPATGRNGRPTVAYGGNSGTEYQVAHFNSGAGPNPHDVFMDPINWTVPNAYASGDWFLVNRMPQAGGVAPEDEVASVSTPCNDPASMTLVAWNYYNGTGSDVRYKVTTYGPPSGYNFRQAATGVSNAPAAGNSMAVYPNPATDVVTIDNLLGADRYELTDMPGRSVMAGGLQAGAQQLSLAQLAPGSYIVTLYTNGRRSGNKVIVKQ